MTKEEKVARFLEWEPDTFCVGCNDTRFIKDNQSGGLSHYGHKVPMPEMNEHNCLEALFKIHKLGYEWYMWAFTDSDGIKKIGMEICEDYEGITKRHINTRLTALMLETLEEFYDWIMERNNGDFEKRKINGSHRN